MFKSSRNIRILLAAVVFGGVLGGAGIPAAPVVAAQRHRAAEVVLSDLPLHGTADYDALKALAHPEGGQMLEFTKSEMWSVPRDRLDALKASAAKAGVGLKVLDQTWNHLLSATPPGSEMTPAQSSMMHQTMESKAAMGISMMALPQSAVIEYALTKDSLINGKAEAGKTNSVPSLVIPLKDDMSVKAQRLSITKTKDSYIWHGTIIETGEPVTVLWWPGGRMSGSVTYRGHVFSLKNMGGAMHAVVEMSPNGLPPEHAPMDPVMRQKMHMKIDPLVSKGDASMMHPDAEQDAAPQGDDQLKRGNTKNLEDAAESASGGEQKHLALIVPKTSKTAAKPEDITITLVVAYTKQAASHFENIETDLIAPAIEDTNQSFRNSGISNVHVELVYAYQTDYAESGSHFDHVSRFADKGDGQMDEIHAIRDRVKGDVAVLVVHDPQGCGLAAGVAPKEDRAFAVVHHECAATSYSIAHEIGHIIGARHDVGLDDSIAPYAYGHGFVHGKAWRTMMSYKDSCDGCPRLPVWSNPDVLVHGVRAGDASSNNARVILEGAARVAGFR